MTHLIDCNKSGFEHIKTGVTTVICFKPERGIVTPGDPVVFQELGETKGLYSGQEITLYASEVISHYHSTGLKTGFYVVLLKEKES